MSDVSLFAVMFNLSGEIIYCNGHFILMTGLSVDEVMARRWNEIFMSPGTGDPPSPFSRWAKNQPDTSHQESSLLTRSGEFHWVRWNSIPLRDPPGTIVGSPVSVRTPPSDGDWSGHCLIQVLASVDNWKANYMTDWDRNFMGSLFRLAPLQIRLNETMQPLPMI